MKNFGLPAKLKVSKSKITAAIGLAIKNAVRGTRQPEGWTRENQRIDYKITPKRTMVSVMARPIAAVILLLDTFNFAGNPKFFINLE